jgi:Lipocalin-like domain
MRSIAVSGFLAVILVTPVAVAQTPKDLEGCWKMSSLVIEKAGEKTEPYGPNPIGQLLLSPDGHFSNIHMRSDLSPAANLQPTGGVVGTIIAYFGTYQVQGKEVVVKIEGSSRSDWRNTTAKRTAESVSADKLVWVDRPEPDMTVRANYDRCAGRD